MPLPHRLSRLHRDRLALELISIPHRSSLSRRAPTSRDDGGLTLKPPRPAPRAAISQATGGSRTPPLSSRDHDQLPALTKNACWVTWLHRETVAAALLRFAAQFGHLSFRFGQRGRRPSHFQELGAALCVGPAPEWMPYRLPLFYETGSGRLDYSWRRAWSKGFIYMKRLRDRTIGLALLVTLGAAGTMARASPGSPTWITDGLTGAQHQEILQGTSPQAVKESPPAGFKAEIGKVVPSSIKLQPMPKQVSEQVPAVKSFDFAMLQDQLLIVDPTSKKVIDIITQ